MTRLMGMKRCPGCDKDKEVTDFSKHRKKPDGRQRLCKLCAKRVHDEYRRLNPGAQTKRNKSYVERVIRQVLQYLMEHPCVDCGETDPIVLEFDHVRGKKDKEVSWMIYQGYSWERVLTEIKKCDVRCANCHRRRTVKQGRKSKWLAELASVGSIA